MLKRVTKSISKGKHAYLNQYKKQTYINRPGKIKCGNTKVMVNRRNSIWIVDEKKIMIIAMVGLNVIYKGTISNGLNKGVNDSYKPWVS